MELFLQPCPPERTRARSCPRSSTRPESCSNLPAFPRMRPLNAARIPCWDGCLKCDGQERWLPKPCAIRVLTKE
eukprot:5522018-Prymnesium_polylepis.2